MIYHLCLECIGENNCLSPLQVAMVTSATSTWPVLKEHLNFGPKTRAWVAKIKSIRGKWVEREFVNGKKDYRHINSTGTRGLEKHYFLEDGLYEISEPKSWRNTDRYFAIIKDGGMQKISRGEAEEWLTNNSLE